MVALCGLVLLLPDNIWFQMCSKVNYWLFAYILTSNVYLDHMSISVRLSFYYWVVRVLHIFYFKFLVKGKILTTLSCSVLLSHTFIIFMTVYAFIYNMMCLCACMLCVCLYMLIWCVCMSTCVWVCAWMQVKIHSYVGQWTNCKRWSLLPPCGS